jgi:hypothetical protein
MKILNYVSGKLIIVAIACGFAASTPIQAQQDDARLVVSRSANFGTFQYLILFVDGVHVADLGLNRSYDTVLPPGQHVLSVSTTPQIYRYTAPTQRRVNAEPGKTYAFTAFWKTLTRFTSRRTAASRESSHRAAQAEMHASSPLTNVRRITSVTKRGPA